MKKKSNSEKLFVCFLISCMCVTFLCISGCGGESCQGISCNSDGIIIPGCGGCFTSGKGCNSSCWPQSFGCTFGCNERANTASCINAYYGAEGCIGCGDTPKINGIVIGNGASSGTGCFIVGADCGVVTITTKTCGCAGADSLEGWNFGN